MTDTDRAEYENYLEFFLNILKYNIDIVNNYDDDPTVNYQGRINYTTVYEESKKILNCNLDLIFDDVQLPISLNDTVKTYLEVDIS